MLHVLPLYSACGFVLFVFPLTLGGNLSHLPSFIAKASLAVLLPLLLLSTSIQLLYFPSHSMQILYNFLWDFLLTQDFWNSNGTVSVAKLVFPEPHSPYTLHQCGRFKLHLYNKLINMREVSSLVGSFEVFWGIFFFIFSFQTYRYDVPGHEFPWICMRFPQLPESSAKPRSVSLYRRASFLEFQWHIC